MLNTGHISLEIMTFGGFTIQELRPLYWSVLSSKPPDDQSRDLTFYRTFRSTAASIGELVCDFGLRTYQYILTEENGMETAEMKPPKDLLSPFCFAIILWFVKLQLFLKNRTPKLVTSTMKSAHFVTFVTLISITSVHSFSWYSLRMHRYGQ